MTSIFVKFQRHGFHHWPNASKINPQRAYLENSHRHLFYVEVEVPVLHDDREIEFHDLQDFLEESWPAWKDQGGKSCETMAKEIAQMVRDEWSDLPWIKVEVSEDNECGARYLEGLI
jgi:hypothetical protein